MRRHLGIVTAAVLLTVVGGLLSATAARPEPLATLAAPPANQDGSPPVGPVPPQPVPPGPAAEPTPERADPEPADPDEPEPALIARSTARLGPVVVDADGFTLYRFDRDEGGAATCTDACASTWRPATVDPGSRLDLQGVDDAAVGLVRRGDGHYQLTLGGWPVYRFAGDRAPGRTDGHGIGGAWFAISPTGGKATS
jgi:predicted lipoprotein with Yx(FWY)xxD motif